MNNGVLGEAKVMTYFIENGYITFIPFGGYCPFDLIIYKEEKLYRVSVKSTYRKQAKKWRVNVSQNTTKLVDGKGIYYHKPFDSKTCDLLAVYIIPEDRVILFESNLIEGKTIVNIPEV